MQLILSRASIWYDYPNTKQFKEDTKVLEDLGFKILHANESNVTAEPPSDDQILALIGQLGNCIVSVDVENSIVNVKVYDDYVE